MRGVAAAAGAVVLPAAGLTVAVECGVPLGGIGRADATRIGLAQARAASTSEPHIVWAVPGLFGFFRDGATHAVAPRCPTEHNETVRPIRGV